LESLLEWEIGGMVSVPFGMSIGWGAGMVSGGDGGGVSSLILGVNEEPFCFSPSCDGKDDGIRPESGTMVGPTDKGEGLTTVTP